MEDVADNLVSSQLARGEKEAQVVRSLCSTLSNTGSSPEIVATTMMSSLKRALQEEEPVLMKDIGIGYWYWVLCIEVWTGIGIGYWY